MSELNPNRDDFASLLNESFEERDLAEGSVVKGIVTAIEKTWPSSMWASRSRAASR